MTPMPYVLKRTDGTPGNNYVNHPGAAHSYTTLHLARRFPTKEAAEAEKCPDNEVAIWVSS